MITEHYLDNSATTRPSEAAKQALIEAADVWGNPSSVHRAGLEAAALLVESRSKVAKSLGLQRFSQDKIIFTSCGTESNNIAMLGCARSKNRNRDNPGTVIVSAGEHPSIENPALLLEKEGYNLVRIPTARGVLDLGYLKNALEDAKEKKSPVIFAAFMLVNNETGALYDVKSASSIVKKFFPDATVHCDAVQGYMKVKFTPASLGADTLTVSAHKIHSFRGAAALFISAETIKRKNIVPVMPGGGQEFGFRSGTENLCSIASFAAAAEDGRLHFDENSAKVAELRAYLDERLAPLDVKINLPEGARINNICNFLLPDIKSETMLNFLSGKGVYVSAGSACSAYSKKKSGALEAFGVDPNNADCAIRVSLSYVNTRDDVDALAEGLGEGIATLQRKR